MHSKVEPDNSLNFLSGGGSVGTLMRVHDWAATPLGSAEVWPFGLKTLVGVMLGSNQPMFIVWGTGRTLLYNDAYADVLVGKHPLALGNDFLKVWHEISDDLAPIVEQAYAGEPVHMDDITLIMERRGYSEETHFAFSYTPVRDESGAVAGFFCPCTEITGQVMAERRLAAETQRQRRLFEQAPGFITILNGPEHTFEFANQAYSRLFGNRDFIGKTVREAFPELEAQPFFEWLDQVYSTGERFVAHHVPIRLQHSPAGAEDHFLDFIYEPVRDEAGRVTGIFCEGHDVTDRMAAEAALRRLNDELESRVAEAITERERTEAALRESQKLEALGQLTGGVAHDFNNLLTIIRSSVEFLRRPNLPEERRRRYIDAITDTVGRAAKLTGQLLAFARRQALKPEVFDVPERIHLVIDMLRTIVGSRIRIVTDSAWEARFVEADVVQFETALVNMAVNARDAMQGEGTLTLHIDTVVGMPSIRGHAGASGEFVAMSISDTGCGISSDKLGHIFEPFFTTKEIGKGTGLGLSQVYGFAKQSGGDVAVKSEVGRGTTFTLYLPKVERSDASNEAGPQARASRQDEYGRGCRVLVVEDNIEVGQFSTQLLQDLGYETTWAANASEALKLLEDNAGSFDVVFSDVVMPGMSGVELGHELRERYPNLPVVLTSGYSHILAEEGRHGFELLHKPYAVEDVSRVLRRTTQGPR